MNSIVSYLERNDPTLDLQEFDVQGNETQVDVSEKPTVDTSNFKMGSMTKEQFVQYARSNKEVINSILAHARKLLDERGINYQAFEQTNKILTDSEYMIDVYLNGKK